MATTSAPSRGQTHDISQPPLVRIVIVNFNAGDLLRRCVHHLLAQDEPRFEAVVVDNASTDASLVALPDDPRLSVLRLTSNVGFAAANNIGFAGCTAPFVAFLNPDAFAETDWLRRLLAAAAAAPADVTMFGSLQLMPQREGEPDRIDGAGDVYHCTGTFWRGGHGQPLADARLLTGEAFGPCAAAAMVRSEAFAKAGGFDESYFCYAEDIDLAFRLRLLGGRYLQVGEARVRHVGSAITGEMGDFTTRHLIRNGIWTFVKCMPWPLLALFLVPHLAFNAWVLLSSARKGRFSVALKAMAAALAGLPQLWSKRRAVQRTRRAGTLSIAGALVCSPAAIWRRSVHLKPVTLNGRERHRASGG